MINTMFFIFAASVLSISFGLKLLIKLIKTPQEKTPSSEITALLYEGLLTLNKRVLSSIAQMTLYTIIALGLFAYIFHQQFDIMQMIAFMIGSGVIAILVLINMLITPHIIPKVISASKGYLEPGLHKQFNTANAISMITFGIAILGFLVCNLLLGSFTIIGYALGITLAGFFVRISSGLFKASANIGADSTSNHPSNPAKLLDIIGTFISSLVGFSSDILGSFIFTLTACVLGIYRLHNYGFIPDNMATKLYHLPLFIIAVSMISSLCVYALGYVRIKQRKHNNVLLEGLYFSIFICGLATALKTPSLSAFLAYSIGLCGAIFISIISEYLTSYRHKPTRNLAKEAEKGQVISIFNTMISGLLSNAIYLGLLLLIVIPAYAINGILGVIMATFGMLSVTSTMMMITLFAPLSSITYKINSMAETQESHKNTRTMDKIGQTTIALGKGFAAGTATLSTISLFLAILYLNSPHFSEIFTFKLGDLLGFLIGVMIPLIFCGLLLKSLKQLVLKTQKEVLRQYQEIPFLLENKAKPDIIKLAKENARFSNDALIIPGLLMALTPILLAFYFQKPMLIGFTLTTCLSCMAYNFFFVTLGDTAHQAKTYIQNGHYGGTDSPTYTHIQITDSIGDAFKDLLGPGINIFMKSIAILAGLLVLILK